MESNRNIRNLDIIGDITQLLLLLFGISYLIRSSSNILLALFIVGTLTVFVYSWRVVNVQINFRTPLSDAIIVLSGVSVVFYLLEANDLGLTIPSALILSPYTSFIFILIGIIFKFLLVDEAAKSFSIWFSNSTFAYLKNLFGSPLFGVRSIFLVIALGSGMGGYSGQLDEFLSLGITFLSLSIYFLITSNYTNPNFGSVAIRLILALLLSYFLFTILDLGEVSALFDIIYVVSIAIWVVTFSRIRIIAFTIYEKTKQFKNWLIAYVSAHSVSLLRVLSLVLAFYFLVFFHSKPVDISYIHTDTGNIGFVVFLVVSWIDKISTWLMSRVDSFRRFLTQTIPNFLRKVWRKIKSFFNWISIHPLLATRYLSLGLAIMSFFILRFYDQPSSISFGVPFTLLLFAFYSQILSSLKWLQQLFIQLYQSILVPLYLNLRRLIAFIRDSTVLFLRYVSAALSWISLVFGPKENHLNLILMLFFLAFAFYSQIYQFSRGAWIFLRNIVITIWNDLVSVVKWIRSNQFRSFRYLCILLAVPVFIVLNSPYNFTSAILLLGVGFSPTLREIARQLYRMLRLIYLVFLEDSSKVTGWTGTILFFVTFFLHPNLPIYLTMMIINSFLLIHGWNNKITGLFEVLTRFLINLLYFLKSLSRSIIRYVIYNFNLVTLSNLLSLVLLTLMLFYTVILPLESQFYYRVLFGILAIVVYSLPTPKRRARLRNIIEQILMVPVRIVNRLLIALRSLLIVMWENIILVTSWTISLFMLWLGLALLFPSILSPWFAKTISDAITNRLGEIIVAFTFMGTAFVTQGYTYARRHTLKMRSVKK